MSPAKLQKARAFARHIFTGKTQSEAFRLTHPESDRWQDKSVHERASWLAAKEEVKEELERLRAEANASFAIDVGQTLREAARLAFADIRQLVGQKDGKPVILMPHELPEDIARAVASFEVDDLGRIKYKLADKNAAIERLFKHLGLFEKDNRQKPAEQVTVVQLVPLQPLPTQQKDPT